MCDVQFQGIPDPLINTFTSPENLKISFLAVSKINYFLLSLALFKVLKPWSCSSSADMKSLIHYIFKVQ